MIQSMTGFGNASFAADSGSFELDVRSVNHRHLDVRVRIPRALASLEHDPHLARNPDHPSPARAPPASLTSTARETSRSRYRVMRRTCAVLDLLADNKIHERPVFEKWRVLGVLKTDRDS